MEKTDKTSMDLTCVYKYLTPPVVMVVARPLVRANASTVKDLVTGLVSAPSPVPMVEAVVVMAVRMMTETDDVVAILTAEKATETITTTAMTMVPLDVVVKIEVEAALTVIAPLLAVLALKMPFFPFPFSRLLWSVSLGLVS